jgi:hypothetical protein
LARGALRGVYAAAMKANQALVDLRKPIAEEKKAKARGKKRRLRRKSR